MFSVGLHFSLNDLLKVRCARALLQIVVATVLEVTVAMAWNWGRGVSLVFGLSLSMASTVVMLRALQARGALESVNGHFDGRRRPDHRTRVLLLPLASHLNGNEPSGERVLLW